MFELKISTENAAFEEPGVEVARILRELAGKVEEWDGYEKAQTIHDANGNDVGRWKLTSE